VTDSTLAPADFVQKDLPRMFSDSAGDDIRRELGTIMADFHPLDFRLMATVLARADTRAFLAHITIPTLLIWGDDDRRSPLIVGHAMRDATSAIGGWPSIDLSRVQQVTGLGVLGKPWLVGRRPVQAQRPSERESEFLGKAYAAAPDLEIAPWRVNDPMDKLRVAKHATIAHRHGHRLT
jgi:hypothetical protein